MLLEGFLSSDAYEFYDPDYCYTHERPKFKKNYVNIDSPFYDLTFDLSEIVVVIPKILKSFNIFKNLIIQFTKSFAPY